MMMVHYLTNPSSMINQVLQKVLQLFFFYWSNVVLETDIQKLMIIFFFSLSVAHDTIIGEVKLQVLVASDALFMFSFVKATLLIVQ